jgi:hypothetical protein
MMMQKLFSLMQGINLDYVLIGLMGLLAILVVAWIVRVVEGMIG